MWLYGCPLCPFRLSTDHLFTRFVTVLHMRITFISKVSKESERCKALYHAYTSPEGGWTRPGSSVTRTMHRAERAQICDTLPDTRCDTRGYRHARASYGPPRATRVANGPGTIGPGPGPAPAAATPTAAPSGGG